MMCENVIGPGLCTLIIVSPREGRIPNQQILVSRINYQTQVNIIISEGRC